MNTSKSPLVSVIIPVYNGEEYIEDAIRSVNSQTYGNIEIIIVDDASEDKSLEKIHKLKDKIGRKTKIFSHDVNKGISKARNKGIKNSRGEYISLLDQDDYYYENRIEYILDNLEDEYGLVLNNTHAIDKSGNRIGEGDVSKILNMGDDELVLYIYLFKYLWDDARLPLTTEFLPRSTFEEIGYFDTELKYINDKEFLIRVLQKFDLKIIPEYLSAKRYHPSQTSNLNLDLVRDHELLTEKAKKYHPFLQKYEGERRSTLNLSKSYIKLKNGKYICSLYFLLQSIIRNPKTFSKNIFRILHT
ncbi:MAG: glycosyltransferase [Candidatus Paceibacteria bacterium]